MKSGKQGHDLWAQSIPLHGPQSTRRLCRVATKICGRESIFMVL